MFMVGQVPGLVENCDIGIFSDTMIIKEFKLCKIVLHSYLYPFITFSVTLTFISRSQQCQTVLTDLFSVLFRLS